MNNTQLSSHEIPKYIGFQSLLNQARILDSLKKLRPHYMIESDIIPISKTIVEHSRLFVFQENVITSTVEYIPEEPGSLDLPFDSCTFQLGSGKPLWVLRIEGSESSYCHLEPFWLNVRELKPLEYEFVFSGMSIVDGKHNEPFFIKITKETSKLPEEAYSSFYLNLVEITRKCLGLLRKKETVMGLGQRQPKSEFNVSTAIRPSRIIYISDKNYQSSYLNSFQKINWSTAWEVRGHWRRTEGLGKNREGTYCVDGFTWVIPHLKGDKNSTPINQIRVVK